MPKINSTRGEVEVTLAGKNLKLVPSLENICEWEDITGKSWLALANSIAPYTGSEKTMGFAYQFVKAKDVIYFYSIFSEEDLSMDEAKDLVAKAGIVFASVSYIGCITQSVVGPESSDDNLNDGEDGDGKKLEAPAS